MDETASAPGWVQEKVLYPQPQAAMPSPDERRQEHEAPPAEKAEKDPYDPEIENWQNFWTGLAFVFIATAIIMFLLGWVACDIYAGRHSKLAKEKLATDKAERPNPGSPGGLLSIPMIILRSILLLVLGPGMFTHGYGSFIECIPENSTLLRWHDSGRLRTYAHLAAWTLLPWACELFVYTIFRESSWAGCFPDAWIEFVSGKTKPDAWGLLTTTLWTQMTIAGWGPAIKAGPFWQIPLTLAGLACTTSSGVVLWIIKLVVGTCWAAATVRSLFLILGVACTALWLLRFGTSLLAGMVSIWIALGSYVLVLYWLWSIPLESICAASRCQGGEGVDLIVG